MTAPKIIKGDPLRAYIFWEGRWCHAYIMGSFDQMVLDGETVRMLYFKLTKNTKQTYSAEKTKFHKKKPAVRSGRKGVEA